MCLFLISNKEICDFFSLSTLGSFRQGERELLSICRCGGFRPKLGYIRQEAPPKKIGGASPCPVSRNEPTPVGAFLLSDGQDPL